MNGWRHSRYGHKMPALPKEPVGINGQIVVDVVATDASGAVFQVEMQSCNETALKEWMLYVAGEARLRDILRAAGIDPDS